jgi:uncharacterized membrane protein YecN with MAPEG domain
MEIVVPITALYAATLSILFVILSVRVSMARGKTKISIGDGNNQFLLRRIRVQGNFAEYIPLALLLLLLAELAGAASPWLHVAGGALFLGRLFMLYGLEYESLPARVGAMMCTYTPLLGLAGYVAWASLN